MLLVLNQIFITLSSQVEQAKSRSKGSWIWHHVNLEVLMGVFGPTLNPVLAEHVRLSPVIVLKSEGHIFSLPAVV